MVFPISSDFPAPPLGKSGWPWTKGTPQNPTANSDVSSWPKVTIVTPSYNQGQFIEETIRSVLLQGYPNLEYIVIDGGSTDNTVEIIRRYQEWLASWVSEPDNGQASAINKGFRRSSGEIMAWLNSDDCLLPGAIRRVAETFQRIPECQIVCGFRYLMDAQGKRGYYGVYLKPDKFSLSRFCYLPQETVFWRRSLWRDVGELDESYQFALDYEFWQRVLAAGYQFHLIPRFMSLYRIHPSAKSQSQSDNRSREIARIYQHYLHTSRTESELLKEISRAWWRRMLVLDKLARKGLLRFPGPAGLLVNLLSLSEKDVAKRAQMLP